MVQILDQYGRPLNKEVLKAPQSSRTFELQRDWPTHLTGNDHCPSSSFA